MYSRVYREFYIPSTPFPLASSIAFSTETSAAIRKTLSRASSRETASEKVHPQGALVRREVRLPNSNRSPGASDTSIPDVDKIEEERRGVAQEAEESEERRRRSGARYQGTSSTDPAVGLGTEEDHAPRKHTEAGDSSAKEEKDHEEFQPGEKEFQKARSHGTCSARWQKEKREEKKEVSDLDVTCLAVLRVPRCFV